MSPRTTVAGPRENDIATRTLTVWAAAFALAGPRRTRPLAALALATLLSRAHGSWARRLEATQTVAGEKAERYHAQHRARLAVLETDAAAWASTVAVLNSTLGEDVHALRERVETLERASGEI